MASNINPNNIDTTYPIAGQDNDSQGFRDNFTNIKTNFQYAETELDDLQAKGIFKSALTGTILDNDMAGALVENMKTQAFRATRIALGSVTGTATIDYSAGQWYTVTTSGSILLAFTNIPASSNASWFNVRINVANVAHTVTLPATVGASGAAQSVAGIQGISSNIITFAETGTYEFEFHTDDGGTTIYLSELTRPRNRLMSPLILAGKEDVAASAAISLATTASYFSTATAETATLAAGTEGQIKTLMMVADGGDMAVTITNAGWKASGTGIATFNNVGEACTLQYVNDKWFCIGNNGVIFT
tara:strand:- start:636 stop:1544 length:909 start_codon:yes stop_codon:yes gene_type:complete